VEGYWLQLGEIVLINFVLSGDNALLIAMATGKLPARQRSWAMLVGIAGAMILRLVLTGVAAELILLPFVRALGALLLIVIAVNLIKTQPPEAGQETPRYSSFWSATGMILLADLTMSLDNVAALAGMAEGNWGLLMIGLTISMIFMVLASTWISSMLQRVPSLLIVGAGILAWTAGRILAEDSGVSHWAGQYVWIMLVLISLLFLLVSWLKSRSTGKEAL
jgi:YjbE family integral membrane protein